MLNINNSARPWARHATTCERIPIVIPMMVQKRKKREEKFGKIKKKKLRDENFVETRTQVSRQWFRLCKQRRRKEKKERRKNCRKNLCEASVGKEGKKNR